ncbi:aladin-like, partial [Tropilaelaps mercedesae]
SKVVTTACWSYDGCQLLFTIEGEAKVYQLSLNPVGEPMAATPRARPIISLEGHPDGISGEVSMMEWEKNCQRLAIAFKHPSTLIAVFATKIKPLFDIKPLVFLRGPSSPEAMKFCEDQSDGGILTVCWSTGQVQHIPMHFEVAAGDRSVVLSRSAVGEISGDFSNESPAQSRVY